MNESNKALLIGLAKALNYEVIAIIPDELICSENGKKFYWNPLIDNADAFKLQVEFGLNVCVNVGYTSCSGYSQMGDELHEEHKNNPEAATRRAIVRAVFQLKCRPMNKILPCPMCGSPAELDSSGTAECYGKDWQTVSIECTRKQDKHCGMELSLTADFWNIRNSNSVLIDAWNNLERKS